MRYPKIIYWKWDDSHVDTGKYTAGIEDITSRSCFDIIFICTHWCRYGLMTPKTHDALQNACKILHSKGKKMILELDARSEKAVFCSEHPDCRTGIVYWKEITKSPDRKDFVEFSIKSGSGADLFAGDRQSGEEILCAYTYERSAEGYIPNTLKDITDICSLERTGAQEVRVSVPADSSLRSKVFVSVVSWYDADDLCSAEFAEYNKKIFERYQDIPLDGAAVDELSFMMSPLFGFSPSTYQAWNDHPYYSYQMEERYRLKFGRSFKLDILNRFIGNAWIPEERIRSINNYHEFIRRIVTSAEDIFYKNVKKYFGEAAFVGVHPTWYAIEEIDNTPEIWKNGIDWWEVPRNYGFTDEIMLYPVRLALTHKANANIFYNMWYGEGEGILQSFFKEIYKNARYGGRTISLSYECRYEKVVQQLCNQGELEDVSDCEERISFLDRIQKSPAASDVLIIMGIPAACSEIYNQNSHGSWNTYDSIFKRIFSLARGIWDAGYNCDLVGSYEIDNKAIHMDQDGFMHYGNQKYSYVIYAYPQYATQADLCYMEKLVHSKTNHMIIGRMDTDFTANNCKERFEAIRKDTLFFCDNPDIYDIIADFKKHNIKSNRVDCGCILQDGAVILTHPSPEKPAGNHFTADFELNGKKIFISAEDAVYLKLSTDGRLLHLEAPALLKFCLDKETVISSPAPKEIKKEALTIAFLGDSITQGYFESYEKQEDEWRGIDKDTVYHNQLKKQLTAYFPDKLIYTINAGIAGNNSGNGLNRMQTDVLDYHPDITVVCFGLNDVHGGENSLQIYRENLKEIFHKLKETGSKVIFMTPNRMCSKVSGDFKEGSMLADAQAACCKAQVSGLMDRYMTAAREICKKEDVLLCDCYAVWTDWYKNGRDIDKLLANHINHPVREMHKLFADMLFECMSKEYKW